ncbi:hypothetical protein BGZ93_005442 [Podila epicladia]|nr:hypothetical protein BGZ93_005442 [Podila epicladia]
MTIAKGKHMLLDVKIKTEESVALDIPTKTETVVETITDVQTNAQFMEDHPTLFSTQRPNSWSQGLGQVVPLHIYSDSDDSENIPSQAWPEDMTFLPKFKPSSTY